MTPQDPNATPTLDGAGTHLEHPNLVYRQAQDRMALLPNYYAWIHSRIKEHLRGSVIELGCGAGYVVRHYVDRVDQVIGVDINPELLAALERSSPPDKVRTVCVDLRGDWRAIEGVRADVIIALDVVEHFEDDDAFVAKLARHLNPNGKVVVKVPAQSRLYGEIDRASGHFRRYDELHLQRLMDGHGLEMLSLHHMNPAGAWGYQFRKRKNSSFSKTFSPGQLKIVNTFLPVLALLDHVPGLKGLSLIGIFQARD